MRGKKYEACRKFLTELLNEAERRKKRMKMLKDLVPTEFFRNMEKNSSNDQALILKGLRTIEKMQRDSNFR